MNVVGRDRIRLGYVGCGRLAQRVHIPNFASLPDCDLVAIAEPREDLRKTVQAYYRIPRGYDTHRELIADPNVDAVGVSGPDYLQGELARDALAAGKHAFVEKPFALSMAQAERILAAGRETGARLMVAYMKRHDAGSQLARRVISQWRQSGEMGRILYARAHCFGGDWIAGLDVPVFSSAEPMATSDLGGSLPDWLPPERVEGYRSYVNVYTHNVNLLRYLLGAEDRAGVRAVDLDEDGVTGATILDIDGVRCVLESGSLAYHRWDEHTQVYFERGWIHVWSPPLLQRNSVAEVEIYRNDRDGAGGSLAESGVKHTITRAIPEPRWSWAYKNEAAQFVHCLRTGEPFLSSGEDALADVRLIEGIFRRWLGLPEG